MAQQKAAEAQGDNTDDVVDELPPGTKLLRGQYTIVRFLNSGGFGITYLAKDSLDRNVVIKECFPSSYCRRSKTVVAARSRAHTAELRSVVQLFVREARNLAKIVHPNIVAVHQVFEDNFTAYMAIDYIDGVDLEEMIQSNGRKLTPEDVVTITEKLINAVGFIHDHDMLHRDISPDNVLIDKSGEPILIDFGAARDEASTKNRAMSALRVVKDGYSPQEFYIAGSEQGPWSDLYALGATLYHLIAGAPPTNGQARLAALAEGRPDPYVPLNGRFQGYPKGFLAAIDKALNTLPAQRVQSAREWLAMFKGPEALNVEGAVRSLVAEPLPTPAPAEPAAPKRAEKAQDFGAPPDYAAKAQPAAAASGKGGGVMIAAGVALLLVAGLGGYMMMGGKEEPAPTEATATETTPAVTETASATTTTETAPATTEAAPAATETTPATTETAAEPAAGTTAETTAATTESTATAEPEPAATETAATTTETAASPEATTETATTAEPAETEATLPAPAGTPRANQVTFAVWDADIPFVEETRIAEGARVSVISRILPTTDLSVVGDWLKPGLILYTVNGQDIQETGGLTMSILNAMQVDPDGKSRVVIEYGTGTADRESGLLTVEATRIINLANGVTLQSKVTDGKWETKVTGVTRPEVTDLRQGDILFRDKTTGEALDGPQTLEEVLGKLVEAGTTLTTFATIRDGKVITTTMQLAVGQ